MDIEENMRGPSACEPTDDSVPWEVWLAVAVTAARLVAQIFR
jgi:hypothetical protein